MDKKNIRVIFNFTINNKDKRHNSNFNSKHYKNSNINNIDGEIWKPIKDFENIYYVSNKGRVKNIISNKLMSIFVVGNYYKVALKSKQYFVHKLVANAFIPNYDNKSCVDHIDTNSLNNNIEIFNSVLDAANSINDSSTNISRVCKANSKVSVPHYMCKRYCFMYEIDFNKLCI